MLVRARSGHVSTRVVGPDGLAATRALWEQAHADIRHTPGLAGVDAILEQVAARLRQAALDVAAGERESYRLVVADDGDQPVGLAALRLGDLGPILTPSLVVADVVHVDHSHRRNGVGKALLEAMAAYATAVDAHDLCVHVPAGNRDTNRYYARWGFTASTLRRTIPVSVLRRKLGPVPVGAPARRRALLGAMTRTAR